MPPYNYTLTGRERFAQFVSDCGGIYKTSIKLDIPPFFIEQVLRNEPVPDHLLDRIEEKVGPIRFARRCFDSSNITDLRRPRPLHERESESEISLKEFVKKCGGLLAASLALGVSTSTIKKILSGTPLSAPTTKKLHRALKAADCSMPSSSLTAPLPKQHGPFEMSGLADTLNDRRGIYPSTIRKLQQGRPISNASQRKLGIWSRKDATIFPLGNTRVNMVSALTSKLREIIKSDVDIFALASKWGVTEISLRKIYEGKPVTTGLVKKVDAAIRRHNPDDPSSGSSAAIERLRTLHGLYNQLGTLEAVGKQVGLTRERIRQLLTKGKKIGLFEYNPREYPYVSKDKIISDYKNTLNLSRIARLNNIPTPYLRKLFTAYSITEKELTGYRLEARRAKCIDQFRTITEVIGHHPSSTELQRTGKGRALYNRITRYWGSIDNFRTHLNIPKPRHIRPHWLDPWRQIALVNRMQHLDTLRDCMSTVAPVGISELCQRSNFGPNRVRRLLALLMATGEIKRIGQLANTKYLLAKTEVV